MTFKRQVPGETNISRSPTLSEAQQARSVPVEPIQISSTLREVQDPVRNAVQDEADAILNDSLGDSFGDEDDDW